MTHDEDSAFRCELHVHSTYSDGAVGVQLRPSFGNGLDSIRVTPAEAARLRVGDTLVLRWVLFTDASERCEA